MSGGRRWVASCCARCWGIIFWLAYVRVLTYIRRTHVHCIYWDGLCVAEIRSGMPFGIGDRVARHIEHSLTLIVKLRGKCERDVVLGSMWARRFFWAPMMASISGTIARAQQQKVCAVSGYIIVVIAVSTSRNINSEYPRLLETRDRSF